MYNVKQQICSSIGTSQWMCSNGVTYWLYPILNVPLFLYAFMGITNLVFYHAIMYSMNVRNIWYCRKCFYAMIHSAMLLHGYIFILILWIVQQKFLWFLFLMLPVLMNSSQFIPKFISIVMWFIFTQFYTHQPSSLREIRLTSIQIRAWIDNYINVY